MPPFLALVKGILRVLLLIRPFLSPSAEWSLEQGMGHARGRSEPAPDRLLQQLRDVASPVLLHKVVALSQP